MKLTLLVLFTLCVLPAWSQTALGLSEELTLNPPWTAPLALVLAEPGRYRLEASGLAGDALEVVVERKTPEGLWKAAATNRTATGALEVQTEWTAGAETSWRVRPVATIRQTVILRLRKSTFASLRETLKQDLTAGSDVPLPLKKRLEFPVGTGGASLAAVPGPRGELWLAWLTAQGGAQVWSTAGGNRIGGPLEPGRAAWTGLALGGTDAPVVQLSRGTEREARAWTGLDWAVEAASGARDLTTPLGTFRVELSPVPRVFRAGAGGWADLELPRNRMLDRILLGSTADGLYALLASSSGREREFYVWTPGKGWAALPPPAASAPPRPGLWSATTGAGALYHLEGQGQTLTLQSFDGAQWTSLDLSMLTAGGLVSAVLVPPSPWSKTGSLAVATDRLTVYDLP